MIATQDIDRIIGAQAVGPDDGKIGKVGQVYVDQDNEQPVWVSVKSGLFGTSETLVPLDGADWNESELHLAFSKDRVKDAPRVEPDGELSPQEQQRLYEYYGMQGAGDAGRGGAGDPGRSGGTSSGDSAATDRDRSTAAGGGAGTVGADRDPSGAGARTGGVGADAGARGAGHDTSGPDTDDAMTRSEERLNVGTQRVEAGRARLRKYVVTDQQTVSVPVTREEVRVEREPITDANRGAALDGPDLSDEEHEVVLTEERPVVEKETVPVERVRLGTETVTDQQQVTEDVRHEEIATDGGDSADSGRAAR